jgi:acyl-CoA thioester hydrolase
VAARTVYRTAVAPEWIDYNGHVRDAYYVLALSLATDALMDQLGMDAAYRARSRCTLYSLEMHVHWLREVKHDDELEIRVRLLGADRKRLHVGFEVWVAVHARPAATAELMLLHVRQDAQPASEPFPPDVALAVEELRAETAGAWDGPRSRALALPVR